MIEKLKKIGLSLSVIVLFALYAGQRQAQTGSTAASVAAIYTPGVTTASESNHAAATVTPQTSSTSVAASSGPNTHTSARSVAVATVAPAIATVTPTGAYRNGTYTGKQADAHWGTVEVVAVITNGQLSDVQFVQYPNHRDLSKEINRQAMPMLTQEAIQSQRANVDIISGATDTSEAFIMSLSSALAQAAS